MTDTDLPEPPAAIQLTPLLGGSASEHLHSLHSIYASHAATILWSIESARAEGAPRRPVIVGIALRKLGDEGSDMERTTFRSAMSLLRGVLDRE
jgi:proteasome assembly chaperone 3